MLQQNMACSPPRWPICLDVFFRILPCPVALSLSGTPEEQ